MFCWKYRKAFVSSNKSFHSEKAFIKTSDWNEKYLLLVFSKNCKTFFQLFQYITVQTTNDPLQQWNTFLSQISVFPACLWTRLINLRQESFVYKSLIKNVYKLMKTCLTSSSFRSQFLPFLSLLPFVKGFFFLMLDTKELYSSWRRWQSNDSVFWWCPSIIIFI